MIKRKILIYSWIILTLSFSIIAILPQSFAYFRALFDRQGINTVMVELIFDQLDFEDPNIQDLGYSNVDENGNEIPWGSKQNPYVISEKYHIQNLSVLQNFGFFRNRIEKDENGNPILDSEGNTIPIQSYFLVCKRDGTPVTIDCNGMKIAPIGTHDLPFTGVVLGAPIEGNTTYDGYGASLSTIADLRVESDLDEPDIGFFGKLGYYGNYDPETQTVTGGYSANIQNLLFADVTIVSRKSLLNTLEEWWNTFTAHLNHSETKKETHHVGVIAGHAEFATIKEVSVYYSEGVETFNLVSDGDGSNTNYYSTTGLIGLLECVNPGVNEEDGTLDGSSGIRDSDLIGDGSAGGGGEESGTLTGYFLAETLFTRHEEYLEAVQLSTKTAYDVKEMKINEKDANGNYKSLFSTVQMSEGFLGWGGDVTYYYFNDTVFTFTMSSSSADSASDAKKTDFVMKLWELDKEQPVIHITDSADKWEYTDDLGATPRISYKLTALESQNALKTGGYYVLAYVHEGNIYIVDIESPGTGFVQKIDVGRIYGGDEDTVLETKYFDDGKSLKEINITSTGKQYFSGAFYYESSSIKMRSPDTTTNNKFGFTVPYTGGAYSTPTPYYGDQDQTKISYITSTPKTAYIYDFTVEYQTKENNQNDPNNQNNGKFVVYTQNQTIGSSYILFGNNYTYISAMLQFDADTQSLSVEYDMNKTGTGNLSSISSMKDETNYFTIMQLTTNTVDEHNNITALANGNYELTPKNIIPTIKNENDPETKEDDELDILASFDPSKHVLEYIKETDSYRLAPIRSYKLNNGKGDLLDELNHTVKLYKATPENLSISFGTFDLYSDGGVLNVPIGTTGENANIPAGMIAFHILEASEEKPSFINVIVAVNPEQRSPAKVGLWAVEESFWGSSFKLNEPAQHFILPVSRVAESEADKSNILTISERVVEEKVDGKMLYTTVKNADGITNETSYVYLGGEYAFIYYSFEVTQPNVTYLLGSMAGSLSISYFSVTGAAGEGMDGMSGSPLGNVDFVYAYNGQIITTDKMYSEETVILSEENYDQYYPSYLFVSMLPEENKIQHEVVKIRRYINGADAKGTKRHLTLTGDNYTYTHPRSVSVLLQDMEDDIEE